LGIFVKFHVGRRTSMEDEHLAFDDIHKKYPELELKDDRCSFYGVFDGHGGSEASKLVKQLLFKNILHNSAFAKGDIESAMRTGFAETDKEVLETSQAENWKSGSTAVVSIIINNTLYVANAGDSEAVLGKRTEDSYEAILLSEKHKPTDQGEKDRIKKAGGHVVFGRVMGSLAVARAFGDRDFKHPFNKAEDHFVSSDPFIKKLEFNVDDDEFLIISCDGLWDRLSYQQAVEFVANCRNEGKHPTETSQLLVKESLERGTLDNVTAIVVYLPTKPKRNPHTISTREIKIEEEEEEDEPTSEMDVYEFLQVEMEKRRKLKEKEGASPGTKKKLDYFNLPSDEHVLGGMSKGNIPFLFFYFLHRIYMCFGEKIKISRNFICNSKFSVFLC
jgi:serine/threonine protein phosphatase PrpC